MCVGGGGGMYSGSSPWYRPKYFKLVFVFWCDFFFHLVQFLLFNKVSRLKIIISAIRLLLFQIYHRDVWEYHRVENGNRLIKQVMLCLINTYTVDWSSKARNSIKLRTYTNFKFDHPLEEYLFYIPDTR